MDEASFQALCNSFTYYHTLDEQNTTIHTNGGFHLQKISSTKSTYIHFAVKLDHHWAAVQLTITPFAIRSIPDQAFYKARYRYALCCDSAVSSVICDTVQKTYDVHYRPAQWDFSSKLCSTIDPGERSANAEDCVAVVASKLREYLESASRSEDQTISTVPESEITDGSARASLKRPQGQPPDDVVGLAGQNKRRKRSQTGGNAGSRGGEATSGGPEESEDENGESEDESQNDEDEDGENVESEEHDGEIEGEAESNLYESKTDSDKALIAAQRLVKKIRSGIKNIGQKSSVEDIKSWLPGGQISQHDLSVHIEAVLWSQGSKATKGGREIRWMHRYLCSCFALARLTLITSAAHTIDNTCHSTNGVSKAAPKSSRTKDRWRSAAHMTNSIVKGLNTWGGKAELVYHALAAKDYSLGECNQMSKAKQQEVVRLVVNQLQDSNIHEGVEIQQPMFDPAQIISQTLHLGYSEVCHTLGLHLQAETLSDPRMSQSPSTRPYAIKKSVELRWVVSKTSLQFTLNNATEDILDKRQPKASLRTLMDAAEVTVTVQSLNPMADDQSTARVETNRSESDTAAEEGTPGANSLRRMLAAAHVTLSAQDERVQLVGRSSMVHEDTDDSIRSPRWDSSQRLSSEECVEQSSSSTSKFDALATLAAVTRMCHNAYPDPQHNPILALSPQECAPPVFDRDGWDAMRGGGDPWIGGDSDDWNDRGSSLQL